MLYNAGSSQIYFVFSNNVYIGEAGGKDEKTQAEKMLEVFMEEQTGHDVI